MLKLLYYFEVTCTNHVKGKVKWFAVKQTTSEIPSPGFSGG